MEYILVGSADFITKETAIKMGYTPDDCPSCPALIYSKDGSYDTGLLYIEIDNVKKVILQQYILHTYNIEESKNTHPELFL